MTLEIPKSLPLEERVFSINNEETFVSIALEVYHFQYEHNLVYRAYCDLIGRLPETVRRFADIPYLPIGFFKSHRVVTTDFDPQVVFTSSGTTGAQTSRHFVKDAGLYQKSFLGCFTRYYGPLEEYSILGLLPSYLERSGSSLVYMVDYMIHHSGHPLSGFYLYDLEKLASTLTKLESTRQKTILFGVTFALLDFCSAFPQKLHNTAVIETGGMKGRKQEMTRPELYAQLQPGLGVRTIHSEYGMTELLSQAYGVNGVFRTPPWMRVSLRDETDPLSLLTVKDRPLSGAINVTDLANLYSCAFIATEDIGKVHPDGSFEVLGRMDHTDIRGCSQLIA